jgi:recombination protein RecA
MKIGVMFGSPETTTGGQALKFYASVRLDVRRIGAIKESIPDKKGELAVVGNRTRVKVVKNKMAPPFREVEFDILYGQGICKSAEVLDMGADVGIVQKSGAWYSVDSERIGQGRDAARQYLEEHPALMGKLEAKLLEHFKVKRPTSESDASTNGKAPPNAPGGGGRGAPDPDDGGAKAAPKRPSPARAN